MCVHENGFSFQTVGERAEFRKALEEKRVEAWTIEKAGQGEHYFARKLERAMVSNPDLAKAVEEERRRAAIERVNAAVAEGQEQVIEKVQEVIPEFKEGDHLVSEIGPGVS